MEGERPPPRLKENLVDANDEPDEAPMRLACGGLYVASDSNAIP